MSDDTPRRMKIDVHFACFVGDFHRRLKSDSPPDEKCHGWLIGENLTSVGRNFWRRSVKRYLVLMLLSSLLAWGGPASRGHWSTQACVHVDGEFLSVDTAHSIAAADLNEDGHLDIAVVAHFPVTFTKGGAIFLGDGRGRFRFLTYLAIGDHNHGVVLTDLNHDGHLDLVTSTADVQGRETVFDVVHTFLGDGTGQFPQHATWPAKYFRLGPLDVQVGDLNHDGHPDLVAAGSGPGHVAVLLGDGTGRFGRRKYYANIPTRTRSTALADFNGDGHLDVVAANRYGRSVSLFLGDGTGQLKFLRDFTTGFGPRSVIAADFNQDGHTDVAVTCREPNQVAVLLGDGAGSFAQAKTYAVGDDPRSIVAADFNGDGRLDLAVTNNKSQTVSLWFGDGRGHFSGRQDIRVGDGPVGGNDPPGEGEGNGLVGLAAADVNEDGRPDLLVTSSFDDHVYVVINSCSP